jgi:hypothetical protein
MLNNRYDIILIGNGLMAKAWAHHLSAELQLTSEEVLWIDVEGVHNHTATDKFLKVLWSDFLAEMYIGTIKADYEERYRYSHQKTIKLADPLLDEQDELGVAALNPDLQMSVHPMGWGDGLYDNCVAINPEHNYFNTKDRAFPIEEYFANIELPPHTPDNGANITLQKVNSCYITASAEVQVKLTAFDSQQTLSAKHIFVLAGQHSFEYLGNLKKPMNYAEFLCTVPDSKSKPLIITKKSTQVKLYAERYAIAHFDRAQLSENSILNNELLNSREVFSNLVHNWFLQFGTTGAARFMKRVTQHQVPGDTVTIGDNVYYLVKEITNWQTPTFSTEEDRIISENLQKWLRDNWAIDLEIKTDSDHPPSAGIYTCTMISKYIQQPRRHDFTDSHTNVVMHDKFDTDSNIYLALPHKGTLVADCIRRLSAMYLHQNKISKNI